MKINIFKCDKCGKTIDGEVFNVFIDPMEKDGSGDLKMYDAPDEILENIRDKDLCYGCVLEVSKVIKRSIEGVSTDVAAVKKSHVAKSSKDLKRKVPKATEKLALHIPSKEDLKRVYIVENHTLQEAADIMGFARSTLYGYVQRYNLQKPTASVKAFKDNEVEKKRESALTVEMVKKLYIEQQKTLPEVAKALNVGMTMLNNFMTKHSISKSAAGLDAKREAEKERVRKYNSTATN